ncbi:unnamed protein product [Ceutorhynchus assimilis]|uniref:Sodium channel and clathrin linker 1 n=1 Tax=Ceutorhynchus assimilis TaxID=467358 RepID=A0A9N9QKZ5_9CUCU|nr:unnamed protein product [Ceutorhynchus assimilis]
MNQESVESLINNYEAIVKQQQQELYYLKHEQDNLKHQLIELINENKQLSQDLSAKKPLPPQTNNNNYEQLISNLKQQINKLINEKECVSKLWQEGIKTIDHLEDEFKQTGVPKSEVQKLKLNYETKIEKLQQELAKNQMRHCEVDQSLENQASALKIVKNLETEVLRLQKRLQEAVEDKNLSQQMLEKKDEVIQSLKSANSNYLRQVREAVCVVEAALNEKDAALFREQQIKDENEKLLKEMTEIVKQTQEKIKQETLKLSIESAEKQKLLMDELSQAQTEIRRKCEEIEALNQKSCQLEREIERMHKGHCTIDESDINKLLILEKNLESTFQKLLVSEKLNIQLTSDKEVIKNDLEQMANIYDRNLKAKEVEMLTLKAKINRLETELNETHEKINNLSKINQDNKQQQGNNETDYKATITEYKNTIKQLQTQIEMKQDLHQKWRKETKIITDNLEKLVTHLKQEVQQFKKENKSLKEDFRKSEDKVRQYKTFLELISKDVNKISHLTLGPGIS